MTRDDWMHDLRRVDEIAIETGKFQQQDYRTVDLSGLVIRSIYWLSVAVWHLIEDKIKEGSHARQKT